MQKKTWLIILIGMIVIAALVLGFHFYKINAFKSALKPLALKDNMLFWEMLTITKTSPNITFAQLSGKAIRNIGARNEIIAKVGSLDPYLYRKELNLYLKLLDLENEYVRSFITLRRALLVASGEPEREKEVETYKSTDKQKTVYHQKTFKKALVSFRKKTDKTQAASKEHLKISKKLLAFEKENAESLSSIIPKRNIIPLLEKAVREL